MAFPGGIQTSTTGFSSTVRTAIQKKVIDTLRAGLVFLPRGAVAPAQVVGKVGDNFTLRVTAYPDLVDAAAGSLTEGVPPSAVNLGIDVQDFTVAQKGAWTAVTDVASFQSPHNLDAVAHDKIARLAAQTIDGLAATAIQAHAVDTAVAGPLTTSALLTAKMRLAERNVEPIPGIGYYAILSPEALLGLEQEDGLNGYVDVTAQAKAGDLSMGVVSQYRGISFLTSTRAGGPAEADFGSTTVGEADDETFTTGVVHGLTVGDKIRFSALTGGTGLAIDTDYFVKTVGSTTTFILSATLGGATKTFSTDVTASTWARVNESVIFLGKESVAFGDIDTMEYFHASAPDSANPLAQFRTFGFKGILGGTVLELAETVTAGVNDSVVPRIYTISVQTGLLA